MGRGGVKERLMGESNETGNQSVGWEWRGKGDMETYSGGGKKVD